MNAITRAERALLQAPEIGLEIDGRAVRARADDTLIEVARREGFEVPHLCWTPGLEPAGNCRACVVEVAGERTLAASCCRRALSCAPTTSALSCSIRLISTFKARTIRSYETSNGATRDSSSACVNSCSNKSSRPARAPDAAVHDFGLEALPLAKSCRRTE